MAQVLRTVNEIIFQAYSLIGEIGDGEQMSSEMLNKGLYCFNDILDQFSAAGTYVPFVTTYVFPFVPGQDKYRISNIVAADVNGNRIVDLMLANYTVTSESPNQMIYPLRVVTREQYYLLTRVIPVETRPGIVWLDNQDVFSDLVFYPIPDQPYIATIQGKVMLNSLDQQDSMDSLPPFWARFMKYALGRELKSYYPTAFWPPENEQEYWRVFNDLMAGEEKDYALRPSLILMNKEPYFWQNILSY